MHFLNLVVTLCRTRNGLLPLIISLMEIDGSVSERVALVLRGASTAGMRRPQHGGGGSTAGTATWGSSPDKCPAYTLFPVTLLSTLLYSVSSRTAMHSVSGAVPQPRRTFVFCGLGEEPEMYLCIFTCPCAWWLLVCSEETV